MYLYYNLLALMVAQHRTAVSLRCRGNENEDFWFNPLKFALYTHVIIFTRFYTMFLTNRINKKQYIKWIL